MGKGSSFRGCTLDPARRYYIRLHVGGRTHLSCGNLSRIESALAPAAFCRVRRSTIVSADRIQAFESLFGGGYLVVFHDGTES